MCTYVIPISETTWGAPSRNRDVQDDGVSKRYTPALFCDMSHLITIEGQRAHQGVFKRSPAKFGTRRSSGSVTASTTVQQICKTHLLTPEF